MDAASSMCSMMPAMTTAPVASPIASTSSSKASSRNRSMSTGARRRVHGGRHVGDRARRGRTQSPWPAREDVRGRTTTGKRSRPRPRRASSRDEAVPLGGCGSATRGAAPRSACDPRRGRSSRRGAEHRDAGVVQRRREFQGVCPPNCTRHDTSAPAARSRSITASTSSRQAVRNRGGRRCRSRSTRLRVAVHHHRLVASSRSPNTAWQQQ